MRRLAARILGVLKAAVAVAVCITDVPRQRAIPRRLACIGEPRLVRVGVRVRVGARIGVRVGDGVRVGARIGVGVGVRVKVSRAWPPSMVR